MRHYDDDQDGSDCSEFCVSLRSLQIGIHFHKHPFTEEDVARTLYVFWPRRPEQLREVAMQVLLGGWIEELDSVWECGSHRTGPLNQCDLGMPTQLRDMVYLFAACGSLGETEETVPPEVGKPVSNRIVEAGILRSDSACRSSAGRSSYWRASVGGETFVAPLRAPEPNAAVELTWWPKATSCGQESGMYCKRRRLPGVTWIEENADMVRRVVGSKHYGQLLLLQDEIPESDDEETVATPSVRNYHVQDGTRFLSGG